MTNHLVVVLCGQVVGSVERTRTGSLRLTYDSDYAQPGATPLSLSLPFSELKITGSRVESFLEGLLPDNEQVRAQLGNVGRGTSAAKYRTQLKRMSMCGNVGTEYLDQTPYLGRIARTQVASQRKTRMNGTGFRTDEPHEVRWQLSTDIMEIS